MNYGTEERKYIQGKFVLEEPKFSKMYSQVLKS